MIDLIIGTIAQGVLWGILAIGVFITFRVLDIADLTVEGSFPLGAGIAAVLLINNVNPLTATIAAGLGGMLAGAVTGLLHTKLKIPALLAGILSMIALYSVNLRVMGRANIPLLGTDTVFDYISNLFSMDYLLVSLIVGTIFVAVIYLILFYFFGTELGVAIRATGVNPQMVRAQGVNTDNLIVLGLMLSNALVAISGALISQDNGFADVGMGIGTIVIGLASVIIGEVLFGRRSFVNNLLSVVLGSIVYRCVIALVLYLGMQPQDLKLFTALVVAIALAMPLLKSKYLARTR